MTNSSPTPGWDREDVFESLQVTPPGRSGSGSRLTPRREKTFIGIGDDWVHTLASDSQTAKLDDQAPETLYYLAKVTQIPIVEEIYVEHRESNEIKHWTVISERDYELLDEIYEIEYDVLERFPEVDVKFRVTVASGDGPSAAPKAMKIFERD